MTTIIHTQVIENYGLEDGKNYWKAKGGNVYFVEGTDNRQWNAVAMVNKIIQEHFGADNAYCQEYISNVEVSDDPYNVIDEYGDVPIDLTFNREITDCNASCCTDKEGSYHGKGILNSGYHDKGTWEDEPL